MFRNNNKECKNLSEDQIIILFQKTVEIGNTLAPLRVNYLPSRRGLVRVGDVL